MEKIIHCTRCKRPLLNREVDPEEGIGYCYGCDYYFPLASKTIIKRDETIIPSGASFIRLHLDRRELEIKIRWIKNYSLSRALLSNSEEKFTPLLSFLAFFLNRTEIQVTSHYLKIEHKPIDLLPMTFYPAGYVKQLYVKPITDNILVPDTLGLYAVLVTGEDKLLLWNLKKRTLLFIEQEIERILEIEDRG
jgi:hypothetical protein